MLIEVVGGWHVAPVLPPPIPTPMFKAMQFEEKTNQEFRRFRHRVFYGVVELNGRVLVEYWSAIKNVLHDEDVYAIPTYSI